MPINALVAVEGTPLAGRKFVDTIEFVRTIAVARILMPKAMVRLSAGRANMTDETQALCYLAGANSIFYGEKLLTTGNPEVDRDDALLAIETLPLPETRHFITRVLYSYWMYSERMGQPAPSLDAVAQGAWPSYVPPVSLTARASGPNAKDR